MDTTEAEDDDEGGVGERRRERMRRPPWMQPPWEAASTFRNWKAGHGRLVGGGGPKETDGHYNKVHHSEARSICFTSPQLII